MRIGAYEVTGELGRGGSGVVRSGRAPDGTAVAIKLLVPMGGLSEAQLRRFERELDVLRRLRHPGIVGFVDAGVHQGRPFLVTELVEGETLQARLDRVGALSPAATVELGVALADALAHAHAAGALHRDLKPDNVLLGPDGRPRLVDFGLTRDVEASLGSLTASGQLLGTPAYWSPEQARGARDALGPWTDVWGLGGVLYAALTREPPLAGSSMAELCVAAIEGAVVPPSARAPSTPRGLEEVVLRCLGKDPRARYPSAIAVGLALRGCLTAAGRRRRTSAALVVALGVLGLVGLALALTGPRAARPASEPSGASARPGSEAAVTSRDAPADPVDPAIALRRAWAKAGSAITATEVADDPAAVVSLELAVSGLEEWAGRASAPSPEQAAALKEARRLLRAPWTNDGPVAQLARSFRRYLCLHTLWRLAEPAHEAKPLPESTGGFGFHMRVAEVALHFRGPGARRRAARVIALAPDDVNAYVVALDLAVRRAPLFFGNPEPHDLTTDLAWFDGAIARCVGDAEGLLPGLVRSRAEYLADACEAEALAAWCGEVERRWGQARPALLGECWWHLGHARHQSRDRRGALAAYRRSLALLPRRESKVTAARLELELSAESADEAERVAALAEAEALLVDPQLSGWLQLEVAVAAARLLVGWRGAVGASRGLDLLRPALRRLAGAWPEASLWHLELMLRADASLPEVGVRERWSEAIDDLQRRLEGELEHTTYLARPDGEASEAGRRHALALRECLEKTVPELRNDLRRGDLSGLVQRARAALGPRSE